LLNPNFSNLFKVILRVGLTQRQPSFFPSNVELPLSGRLSG
jgi:hypothetical protein